jgi:adenosylcobyric acid synthase
MSDAGLRGAVMVCGTASNSGKSLLVAGLCRLLARRGVSVAPFKGQNMSLNSVVTEEGAEIGRAQGAQAEAAGIPAEVAMNPVLLKPMGERRSQVIVMGKPWRVLDAADYQATKPELAGIVLDALADLRRRFDVVVLEGAGSPAEINLMEGDLVNLGLAARAGIDALVVGDIDRGGVFAHLFGTVELLPADLRRRVRGFIINKLRGDPALLGVGPKELEARTGVPTLGVIPWLDGVWIDAEDSLALSTDSGRRQRPGHRPTDDPIDVAAFRFPRLSNFTDVDALAAEPGVSVRWVETSPQLGDPDLVVLPGTKSTVGDLDWLRRRNLDRALADLLGSACPPSVLGICGGYQMLGRRIVDEAGVESASAQTQGLGLLDVETTFATEKRTVRRRGREMATGTAVAGYEIHHGLVAAADGVDRWFELEGPDGDEPEGVCDEDRGIYATTLHGVLETDDFRAGLLARVAARRAKAWGPSSMSFAGLRRAQVDRVADAIEAHLDTGALWQIIAEGALR